MSIDKKRIRLLVIHNLVELLEDQLVELDEERHSLEEELDVSDVKEDILAVLDYGEGDL